METINELDVANKVDNNTMSELIEGINELWKLFEDLNKDTTTYRTNYREIDPQ